MNATWSNEDKHRKCSTHYRKKTNIFLTFCFILDKAERAKFDAEGKGFEKQLTGHLEIINESKVGAQKEALMKGATGAFGMGKRITDTQYMCCL